ncbi:MAG: glycosyltransferase, partial [Synergistaceae bacterium]|nr:glycosyltransferase [Synergistaceae bacterium]
MSVPLVSICCMAYDHDKYIKDALDSFLMQKTAFPYEIIIHDDASTDSTQEIIKSYARKNPNIIPIFQKENKYSQRIKLLPAFVYPKVSGKYIAVCEGDDYWTDPDKLQKQIEYMEGHPECTLCVHASNDVSEKGEFIKKRQRYKTDRIVPMEDLILGGGGFAILASTVYPSRLRFELPSYYFHAPVGDVPLHLFLASKGSVFYFHDNMADYRTGVPGSWTSEIGDGIGQKQINQQKAMSDMYKEFAVNIHSKYCPFTEFMALKCKVRS